MKKNYFNILDMMFRAITTDFSTAKFSRSCAVIKEKGWVKCGLWGPPTNSPLRSSLAGWYEWGCWRKASCAFASGWSSCQMRVSLYTLPPGWQQASLQALPKKQETQCSWGYFSCQISCSLLWSLNKNSLSGLSYPGSIQASFLHLSFSFLFIFSGSHSF